LNAHEAAQAAALLRANRQAAALRTAKAPPSFLSPAEVETAIRSLAAQNFLALRRRCLQPTADGFCAFVEAVMVDEGGDDVEQAPIHASWIAHVLWCHERGVGPVVLAPWGHGKSVNLICALTAWMLAIDPSLMVRIVTNSDENAKGRMRLIRAIMESERYTLLFPHVTFLRKATDETLHLDRPRGGLSANPSVIASTIGSSRAGPRCNVLLIDDVADLENSVLRPADRAKVAQSVKGSAKSRLIPRKTNERRPFYGLCSQIGTRWHEEDWWGETLRSGAYCVLVQAVTADNSAIACAVTGSKRVLDVYPPIALTSRRDFDHKARRAPVGDIPDAMPLRGYDYAKPVGVLPVWEAGGYGKEQLDALEEEDERVHNCGRRQAPYADGSRMFPNVFLALRDVDAPTDLADGWVATSGVDLAGESRPGTAIVTVAERGRERLFCDVQHGRWSSPQTSDAISTVYEWWQPALVVVESNGYQGSLISWGTAAGAPWTRSVVPFNTGSNKFDPTTGIQSIDIEFRNGAWTFPARAVGLVKNEAGGWESDGSHPRACKCSWCVLWRVLVTCTEHDLRSKQNTVDLLMALWFAVCGLARVRRRGVRFGTMDADGSSVEFVAEAGDIGMREIREGPGRRAGVLARGAGGNGGAGSGGNGNGSGNGQGSPAGNVLPDAVRSHLRDVFPGLGAGDAADAGMEVFW
jgi:hypothetical protein